jgi:hypothetical protein
MKAVRKGKGFRLELDAAWLQHHTLIDLALEQERDQWASVGLSLE